MEAEDSKFKSVLKYIVSSKPAWTETLLLVASLSPFPHFLLWFQVLSRCWGVGNATGQTEFGDPRLGHPLLPLSGAGLKETQIH